MMKIHVTVLYCIVIWQIFTDILEERRPPHLNLVHDVIIEKTTIQTWVVLYLVSLNSVILD